MKPKRGIPKEIIDQIDITKKEKRKEKEVTIIVEEHQAKIPIPKIIRLKMNLKKGDKCLISFDEKSKKMTCKFK